jgi:hypothetical protein
MQPQDEGPDPVKVRPSVSSGSRGSPVLRLADRDVGLREARERECVREALEDEASRLDLRCPVRVRAHLGRAERAH